MPFRFLRPGLSDAVSAMMVTRLSNYSIIQAAFTVDKHQLITNAQPQHAHSMLGFITRQFGQLRLRNIEISNLFQLSIVSFQHFLTPPHRKD
jgi:hypothetical protein